MSARIQNTEYFTEVVVNFIDNIGHWGEITLCKEIEILYKIPERGYEDYEVTLRYFSEGKTSSTAVPSGEHTTGLKSGYKAMWLKPTYFYSVAPGEKFRLRLQAYNPKTYDHLYYDLGINFCRPKVNDEITAKNANFEFEFKEYVGGYNNYFYGPRPGIIVKKWPSLSIEGPYPDFQAIKIQLKDSAGTVYFTGTREHTEDGWGETEISKNVPSKFSSAATLSVYLIDKTGTSALIKSKFYQSGRSSISFLPGEITFNASPYNPYYSEKNSLIIKHPLGNSPASQSSSISYSYSLESNIITPDAMEKSDNMCEATYARESLIPIFSKDTIQGVGQIPIKITAQNAFGDTTTISTTLPYDYYLMAQWEEGSKVGIKHDFDGGTAEQIPNISLEEYSNTDANTHQLNLRCFCSGESAILELPKAIDPNDEAIYYRIQRAVTEYSNGIPSKEGLAYEDLITFYKGGRYNYQIPILDEKDYCCYFRVCATNRTSNAEYTEYKYSPLIFLCRTAIPSFGIDSVELTSQNGRVAITFTKKELDFGQSDTFKNYERNLEKLGIEDLPVATLKLKVDRTAALNSVEALSSTLSSFEDIRGDKWFFNIPAPAWDNWENQKIYLELKLEVNYGPNSKANSQPYTYFTIISGVPTVAHRKNHVGINTVGFTISDTLRIAPVDNRTLITFEFLEGNPVSLDLTNKETFRASLKEVLGI